MKLIHVVAAVIRQPDSNNSFLISKRQTGKHLEHFWELPGGKKEANETRKQALYRELSEELKIEVVACRPFMEVTHEYSDRTIHLDVWEVSDFRGAATGNEGQEIRWVSIDKLDDFQFPDADIPILKAIKNSVTAKTARLP